MTSDRTSPLTGPKFPPAVKLGDFAVSERTAFLIFMVLMFMMINVFVMTAFILDDVVEIHHQLETEEDR
jgi:hypothetical protein